MKRIATIVVLGLLLSACGVARGTGSELVLGAVYPTTGGQGRGGIDEYRGVQLAAEYVNARGGVDGARVRLRLEPAANADQAPGAVRALAADGIPLVFGSHGSTIAHTAALTAQSAGVVFWETGAIGPLGMSMTSKPSPLVFRFAPTGTTLGRNAVSFAAEKILPMLGQAAKRLRYAVTYVDDDYGRSVGLAARDEVRARGFTLAGVFPYSLPGFDAKAVARDIAASNPDVLFVAAYLDDGVAVRKALLARKVHLVASVGTSSSYCMHEFGVQLGKQAVGLFASDKPDGNVIDASRLTPDARAALTWARATWKTRYHDIMHAGALTGFAGALAVFRDVLPRAHTTSPRDIAIAARSARVPMGGLPNGGGLAFASDGGDNLRATSVIWEWVKPRDREVVWPPAFATHPIVPIALS